jgi:CheY-like chemotaxis protein
VPVPATAGAPVPIRARAGEVVLIAEDDASLRALMTTTLTDLGYRVLPTSDGEEAVRELDAHQGEVSLAILDVVMPRLGAREARARIVAIRPDMKILLTSGYAPDSERLGEIVAGPTVPLLEKPFTPQALALAVRAALDSPR